MSFRYLSNYQADVVHAWWRALQPAAAAPGQPETEKQPETENRMRPFFFDRGPRARLRRASSIGELEAESSCFALRERLGRMNNLWLEQHDDRWLFLLAGAVALITKNTAEDRSLGLALGCSSPVNGAPPMSGLRFRRLLRENEPEPFFRQLRRALQLATGPVNAAQLANDLLGWTAERDLPSRPAEAMHYRWARDYFLDRKDRKHTAPTGTDSPNRDTQETHA